jgi:hypothetical protein
LLLVLGAFAPADTTDYFRDFAAARAFWTDAGLLDVAEYGLGYRYDLPGTAALITGLEFVSRFDSRAFAVFTGVIKIQVKLHLGAENGLLETNIYLGLNVTAAGRLAP